jgi:uncharacterized protein (DUF1697 family)
MQKSIAILRGINVSGKNKIKMEELRDAISDRGFKNVETYIQSGNIIFDSESNSRLEQRFHEIIREEFGYDVPVLVRSIAEFSEIVTSNPFLDESNGSEDEIEEKYLHVTFLSREPEADRLKNILDGNYAPDRFIPKGKNIYLYTPGGYGKTRLSNNFFESKLNINTTTRNWKTVNTLFELANK